MPQARIWTTNRTIICAVLVTAGLAALIFFAKMPAYRALVPLALVWGFAMHILDTQASTEAHKAAMEEMLGRLERSN